MQSNLAINELNTVFVFPDEYVESKGNQPLLTGMEKLFESIKKTNRLPFTNGDILYSDKLWDFSSLTSLAVPKHHMKISFRKTPEVFEDELKCYVITKILDNKIKIQSIRRNTTKIDQFLRYADSKGYCYVKDIPSDVLASFLNTLEEPALSDMQTAIKTFYDYYAVAKEDITTPEIKELYTRRNGRVLNARRKVNKIKNIPEDYFDKLVAGLIAISNDTTLNKGIRGAACIDLIVSQTGLRVGECLFAKVGCIQEIKIFNGETSYYMTYGTWKRISGNNRYVEEKTYVNAITKNAVDILIELFAEERKLYGVDYLYLGDGEDRKPSFPLTSESYNHPRGLMYAYMDKYVPVINIENPPKGIVNHTVKSTNRVRKIKAINADAETLAYPSEHQFRVHVCTELYKKGVPLQYIEKFMGHLSKMMAGYYVRITPKNPQEDMNFSMDTLKKLVSGEIVPLGGTTGLMDRINKFIEDGHYNIYTDMNSICESLAKKIPIRQKTGGVCIKASMMRECSKDAPTNEFYCAYGVCPNIYHFFYMADISYRQCKELTETIEINAKNGFVKQVQKETGMRQKIATNRLVPQLDELKRMVETKGLEHVTHEYPDLKDIIENYDVIYKEALSWKIT